MKSVRKKIVSSRSEFISDGLNEEELSADPIDQFEKWMDEAMREDPEMANAVHLATTGPDGRPSGRIVLLRGFDQRGFVFYTNYDSRKGSDLKINNNASMTFFWSKSYRKVRIEGTVFKLPPGESDSYFSSRPRESNISALASRQSRPLENRKILEERVRELENKLKDQTIKRPDNWGGYCLSPLYIEFWQGMTHRLHDRIFYRRENTNTSWTRGRLYP